MVMNRELAEMLDLLDGVRTLLIRDTQDLTDHALHARIRADANTIGMLVLHVADMERFMIGQMVGGLPLGIDRRTAFQAERLTRSELLELLTDAAAMSRQTLKGLNPSDLDQFGMQLLSGLRLSKRQTIMYAIAHASHHRGQILLLRKWVS